MPFLLPEVSALPPFWVKVPGRVFPTRGVPPLVSVSPLFKVVSPPGLSVESTT